MLRFPEKKVTRPTIHLTALIDIVFLLLVFFLLASNFIEQQPVAIVVPEVEHESSGKLSNIVVTIDQDANVYYQGELIGDLKLLRAGLEIEIRQRDKSTVVIQADRRVTYDRVVQVIDVAKLAGAHNLLLVTTKKSPL